MFIYRNSAEPFPPIRTFVNGTKLFANFPFSSWKSFQILTNVEIRCKRKEPRNIRFRACARGPAAAFIGPCLRAVPKWKTGKRGNQLSKSWRGKLVSTFFNFLNVLIGTVWRIFHKCGKFRKFWRCSQRPHIMENLENIDLFRLRRSLFLKVQFVFREARRKNNKCNLNTRST